jgi:hypothetical protein
MGSPSPNPGRWPSISWPLESRQPVSIQRGDVLKGPLVECGTDLPVVAVAELAISIGSLNSPSSLVSIIAYLNSKWTSFDILQLTT